jgi:MFS family permease
MGAQLVAALCAAALATVTLTGHASVVALYLLTAAGTAVTAFDEPALQSLVPHLVPRRHLANAVSLNTLLWQIGTVVGPAVAGVLVSLFNIGLVYAINAATFLWLLGAVALMQYRGVIHESAPRPSWASLVEGVRFTYRTRLIWSTMLLDFLATFFSSARTMLPIVADSILGVGVQGYGVLATAQPLGAVLAGIVLSWRKSIVRQGAVLLVSVVVYGLATAFFGLSTVFELSYVLFALTGAGDTVSTVIRATIRQILTPDHLRGRMSGVHMILAMGGPQLGELEAGLVAALLGAPFAIVTGGAATVLLTAWIAWRSPALRHYRQGPGEDAVVAEPA